MTLTAVKNGLKLSTIFAQTFDAINSYLKKITIKIPAKTLKYNEIYKIVR